VETSVYTKDIQNAQITYVLNYNLQPENAHRMYREVGQNYLETVVTPVVEGTLKDVIGKWNAQDLIANREKATQEILVKLQDHLAEKYINVTDFQMTAIAYSSVFEKAIESKVTAEQEAQRAKNKTVQVQEEARQKVIAAEAEAKSMAIRAQALSQNKSLVQYEAVQKWDGKMPQYMLGNSVPFINVSAAK
jgi:regulator of protease activity HflC (stomatin/prohibitin superfamily)